MRLFLALLGTSLTALGLIFAAGCGGTAPPEAPVAHDDHDAHDHDGHDHVTTIDADAAGLSTDDLVSIDQPDVPDNYDDAVTQLVTLRDQIRDAFEADNEDAAHDPLHEIGHLLGGIETLVANRHDDAAVKKKLVAAVDELFDSYTAVDETFHSDGGKKYSEVESKIDAAVETLQAHLGHE